MTMGRGRSGRASRRATGPRTIVFDLSGTILLKSELQDRAIEPDHRRPDRAGRRDHPAGPDGQPEELPRHRHSLHPLPPGRREQKARRLRHADHGRHRGRDPGPRVVELGHRRHARPAAGQERDGPMVHFQRGPERQHPRERAARDVCLLPRPQRPAHPAPQPLHHLPRSPPHARQRQRGRPADDRRFPQQRHLQLERHGQLLRPLRQRREQLLASRPRNRSPSACPSR